MSTLLDWFKTPHGRHVVEMSQHIGDGMHDVTVEGFHWRDGWYFKRIDGGHVRITRVSAGHEAVQFSIPPLEWASIVASVSDKGEDRERWEQAAKFHGGTEAYEHR